MVRSLSAVGRAGLAVQRVEINVVALCRPSTTSLVTLPWELYEIQVGRPVGELHRRQAVLAVILVVVVVIVGIGHRLNPPGCPCRSSSSSSVSGSSTTVRLPLPS